MCLVYDDGKALSGGVIHLGINHRKLLQGGYDNAAAVVDSVSQVLGGLALSNGFYCSEGMVKGRNGVLLGQEAAN